MTSFAEFEESSRKPLVLACCVTISLAIHAAMSPLSLSELGKKSKRAEVKPSTVFSEIAVAAFADPASSHAENNPTPKAAPPPPPRPKPVHAPRPAPAAAVAAPARADSNAASAGGGVRVSGSAQSNAPLIASQRLAAQDAGLSVIMDFDKVRSHSARGELAELFADWQSSMAPRGFDALRDVDSLLITLPALGSSSHAIAAAAHHVAEAKLKRAIGQQLGAGAWLDGAKSAAHAQSEAGDRYWFMPSPELLVMSHERETVRLPSELPFDHLEGASLAQIYIENPSVTLSALPFAVPRTLHWMRATLEPAGEGVAMIGEGGDETAESAKASASALSRSLKPLLRNTELTVAGSVVRAKITFSRDELRSTLKALREGFGEASSPAAAARATEPSTVGSAGAADTSNTTTPQPSTAPAASAPPAASVLPAPSAVPAVSSQPPGFEPKGQKAE